MTLLRRAITVATLAAVLGILAGPATAQVRVAPLRVVDVQGRPVAGGASATPFRFDLGRGAACSGDSANGGFRVRSFHVPAGGDLGALRFDGDGPVAVPGEERGPMYGAASSQTPYVTELTAEADRPDGPGVIIQPLPSFSFAAYDVSRGFRFPAGRYDVGVACTHGPASPTQLDRVWRAVLDVRDDPADTGPAKLRWRVVDAASTASSSSAPGPAVVLVVLVALVGGLAAARSQSRRRRSRAYPLEVSR